MKLLMILVSLIVLAGCSSKEEPYIPEFYKLSKIPKIAVRVNSLGGLDKAEKVKVFKQIKRLRIVENYYYWL